MTSDSAFAASPSLPGTTGPLFISRLPRKIQSQQSQDDPVSMVPATPLSTLNALDGGPPRQDTDYLVPGAFDDATGISSENDPHVKGTDDTIEQKIHERRTKLNGETGSAADPPVSPSLNEINGQKTKPAIPLRSLARELYATDYSGISDTASERSLRRARRRALGLSSYDSASPPEPVPPLPTIPFTARSYLPRRATRSSDEPLSPTQPASRRMTVADSIQKARRATTARPCLSLQPLRPKKVVVTEDDLPNGWREDRKQSLSIQPIRRQSKSMDENISSDIVKKSRTYTITTPSPAERQLRKSIAGLESLMQEAVQLAKEAADTGRSEEVPGIMHEARLALRRVSSVRAPRESSSSSSSSCSSQSSLNWSHKAHADGPGSEPKATTDSLGARSIWDEDWPHHRLDASKLDGPKSFDFAARPQVSRSQTADAAPIDHPLLNQQRAPPKSANRQSSSAPPIISMPKQNLSDSKSLEQNVAVSPSTLPAPPAVPVEVVPPVQEPTPSHRHSSQQSGENWGRDKFDERDYVRTDSLKGKHHLTLRDNERFSIRHGHKHQPIARNWSVRRKRIVATVACINTALVGLLIGIYAGEVPAIQYTLADLRHQVILGNVYLYVGMALTTFVFWPLPLLHGRKPYTLLSLGCALPLQIPQAIIVRERRESQDDYSGYMSGLLLSRAILGLVLGFAHINFKSTLLDLYGSSLQSEFPHGEVVIVDDVRRHGGGMGYWIGIWSFCFIGSLALGFLVGADVVSGLNQAWGFYIGVMVLAFALFLNVLAPETRRAPHRRTMQEVELPNESISRRVARGEIKMHVTGDGPKWWWEEVFAGMYLSMRMLMQSGFLIIGLYMGWIYAQVVLIIVLLGNLLSARYNWTPEYVGLGVFGIAIGAALAIPNSKANFFSRSRNHPPRTDSMTFQPRIGWTSHLVRRLLFMIALPIAGLAYTLASAGEQVQCMVPIVFAGLIGYISNLAIAECNGIIMETFDTSDLQPGTNSRHRLQSLSANIRRKRTSYTSYPRVSAGVFSAQALGFLFAAAATGVGGAVTRTVGAQKATAITAGILLFLTLLLTCALVRFRTVQVIPNELFGQYFGSTGAERLKSTTSIESDRSWRAVVIGNPSGKLRRMSWLELGSLSRWTEIRRLNRLLNRSSTQGLSPGWQ